MLLRRTPPADPLAEARIAALLGGSGGWVPPAPLPERSWDGGAGRHGRHVRRVPPVAGDDADEPSTDYLQWGQQAAREPVSGQRGACWDQPLEVGRGEQQEHHPMSEGTPATNAHGGPARGGQPGGSQISAWQRWRRGWIDPGRRGVAALALVAVLAAALAAFVVVRGRPRAVPPPAVLSAGVPVPGSAAAGQVGSSGAGPAPAGAVASGAGTSRAVAGPAGTVPGTAAAPAPGAAEVVVSVGGKVRRPGLVRLPAGSRVDDALRAAGGPRPGVDVALLNLARRLVDGEQVLVGVTGQVPSGSGTSGSGTSASGASGSEASGGSGLGAPGGPAATGPLDLNAATPAQLDELPGIGPVLAQRIVDWRTENGRFGSVDQLREVSGIGESIFARLRDEVRV